MELHLAIYSTWKREREREYLYLCVGRVMIVPVLYGCETWVSHIAGEHRLWVFGNRVRRELLSFMRENVAGECGRIF